MGIEFANVTNLVPECISCWAGRHRVERSAKESYRSPSASSFGSNALSWSSKCVELERWDDTDYKADDQLESPVFQIKLRNGTVLHNGLLLSSQKAASKGSLRRNKQSWRFSRRRQTHAKLSGSCNTFATTINEGWAPSSQTFAYIDRPGVAKVANSTQLKVVTRTTCQIKSSWTKPWQVTL